MSTTKIVVLVVVSVLVVCLIGAGVVMMIGFGGSLPKVLVRGGGVAVAIDEAADLDVGGVQNVNVRCVSGDIIIAQGEPRAELVGNVTTNEVKDAYLVVERDGGALTVRFDADTTFPGFLSGNVTMRVWLPRELVCDINVWGASAGVSVADMRFGVATFKSVSGAVTLEDCAGDTLDAGSTSGSVRIEGADFARVSVGSVSGGVAVSRVSGDLKVNNVSGAVYAGSVAGGVSIDNTSGSVHVDQPHKELQAIDVGTISGSVDIRLHDEAAFELSAKSTSGSLRTDFDVLVRGGQKRALVGSNTQGSVNGGGARVDITTVSGGIRVGRR